MVNLLRVNTTHNAYQDKTVPSNAFVPCVPRYTNRFVVTMVRVMPVNVSWNVKLAKAKKNYALLKEKHVVSSVLFSVFFSITYNGAFNNNFLTPSKFKSKLLRVVLGEPKNYSNIFRLLNQKKLKKIECFQIKQLKETKNKRYFKKKDGLLRYFKNYVNFFTW